MHLKLAGILGKISGLLLGHFIGPRGENVSDDVERITLELTQDNPVPIVSRHPHGHTLPNLTIPHGVPVVMSTDPLFLVVRDRS